MRYNLILSFATLAMISGCSQQEHSKIKSTPLQQLPGDVPSNGRSLFDQLTMQQIDGRMQQSIPYPFTELRAQLESHMQSPMAATLIPRGRSLQRHATDQPFLYPRVVMASVGQSKADDGTLGFQLKDRLYIGYVEITNQLEVISYNPDLGRFEFQLVENYGSGLAPRVRYANREFCLACHQNESPIFSDPSWDETAANPKIQEQLLAAIKKDNYLGIPIRQLRSVPNAIDDSTDRADLLIPMQKLWRQGCDTGDSETSRSCRRSSLELALEFKIFGSFNQQLYDQVKPQYLTAWGRHFPDGLMIPQNNIPNFNPLQDFKGGSIPTLLGQLGVNVKTTLEQLAVDSNIPAAAEPLNERKVPREIWTAEKDDAARLIFALSDEFTDADVNWLRSLVSNTEELGILLTKLYMGSTATFTDAYFVRCRVISDIANIANVAKPNCEQRDFANMPAPEATGSKSDDARVFIDPGLNLLNKYCSGCHSSGPLNFLQGEETNVLRRLKQDASAHLQRLDWESGIKATMPPPSSAARQQLETRPEDRQAIRDFLKSL